MIRFYPMHLEKAIVLSLLGSQKQNLCSNFCTPLMKGLTGWLALTSQSQSGKPYSVLLVRGIVNFNYIPPSGRYSS